MVNLTATVRRILAKKDKVKADVISVYLGESKKRGDSVSTSVTITHNGKTDGANLTLRFDRGDTAVLAGYPQRWALHDDEEEGGSEEGFFVSKETEKEIFVQLKKSLEKQFSKNEEKIPEAEIKSVLKKMDKAIAKLK
jgi:hypothetical protein